MKMITTALFGAILVSSIACDNDFKDKPAAKVSQEAKKSAAKAEEKAKQAAKKVKEVAAALSGPLQVDAKASSIGFVGAKVTGKHEGSFKQFKGSAEVAGSALKSINFEVVTSSVDSDDPKLTGHLKSKDFFEVEKFPKATFASDSIVAKVAGANTHEITGKLSLRGTSKSITFPAKVAISPTSVTGTAEFTINRKDFGIQYPGMKDDLIKDDVLLKLNLTFPRK